MDWEPSYPVPQPQPQTVLSSTPAPRPQPHPQTLLSSAREAQHQSDAAQAESLHQEELTDEAVRLSQLQTQLQRDATLARALAHGQTLATSEELRAPTTVPLQACHLKHSQSSPGSSCQAHLSAYPWRPGHCRHSRKSPHRDINTPLSRLTQRASPHMVVEFASTCNRPNTSPSTPRLPSQQHATYAKDWASKP